jgi:hypothetical protein
MGEKDIAYLNALPQWAVSRLWSKVQSHVINDVNDTLGCQLDMGGAASEAHPRHVLDQSDYVRLLTEVVDANIKAKLPKKFQSNHIALLASGKRVPTAEPPAPPSYTGKAKTWRWVASHQCHKSRCTVHLAWEPDWLNRSRDNCLATVDCPHCHGSVSVCEHTPKCLKRHAASYGRTAKKAAAASAASSSATGNGDQDDNT